MTKARVLISGAERNVIDTTWGNSEEQYSSVEKEALASFLGMVCITPEIAENILLIY